MNFTFNAEHKMRVGPSDRVYRHRFQTAPMLLRLNAVVVSDSGKRHQRRCQVSVKKVNASEPLRRRRKDETMSEPMSSGTTGISMEGTCVLSMRHPAYRRHELNTGLCSEQENLSWRWQGKTPSGGHRKGESTDASHGGGTLRSSEEVPVMGMERRGRIIVPTSPSEKPRKREVSRELGKTYGSRKGLDVMDNKSHMMREYQVRFYERLGVKFPGSTRQPFRLSRAPLGTTFIFLPIKRICHTIRRAPAIAALALLSLSCVHDMQQLQQTASLKEVFHDDFLIGTALSTRQINQTDRPADSLTHRQFNAITAENIMKAENIHPQWGEFDFDAADKFIAYGKQHGMHTVGHTLIWHSQLPPFVQTLTDADSLRQFMDLHIHTIAQRYASSIDSWDVVNEALNEDGSWRQSVFYDLLGEDYVVGAFRMAAEAATDAKLYYNDYNIEQPKKRAGAIRLIKKLQDARVRIDGVGIQGHWQVGKLPLDAIEQSILEYAALGLDVAITELDLDVLPRDFEGADVGTHIAAGNPELNPYVGGLPDSVQQQQATDYENLFRLFLKHRDKISRVTFWGVNDGQSWLNYWPIAGRTNYPLVFDRDNRPKEAFFKIINTKKTP
ncbi:endo-1,4-beta-xylanase [Parapedobacter soli]|uniref:endo-1,4-beta-xylanase n=1 Tax=Parapedobacter soli TaxID=416955 RepID=UPI0021C8E255|nr:endo-1,4-beta-xylanase [Parapedobacter soli]